jgi:signal transduction histidine kinase
VRADLPLDQPSGRLTDIVSQWHGLFRNWEAIMLASWVIDLALVWSTGGTGTVDALVATVLIFGLAAGWVLVGRGLATSGGESWRGVAYLFAMLALFAPTVVLAPEAAWMLFGLCPQPYMTGSRRPVLWVAVFNAVPVLMVLFRYGTGTAFTIQLVVGAGALVFAHFIGTFITGMATESTRLAELIQELEASRAQVVALSREAGVAAERERLAGEIHDTLAQGFTSILTLVQAADATLRDDPERASAQLKLATTTARENLGEARALVGALAPAALGTGTLVDALRRQSDRLTEECGIAVRFDTCGELGALAMPVEVVLLRAAQEALTNVRRHSGATSADLRLAGDADGVRLAVVDDGAGFDTALTTGGFGLAGMRSRVEQIGGSVTVHSGPTGTWVTVEVPR